MSTHNVPATSPDVDELAPGMKVGRYRLVSRIASGGMACVWAAEPDSHSGIGRIVALKVIRSELAQDMNYARMFIDEATIATAVRHPNVCEVYELDRHGDFLFMAMEFVAGDSLSGLLRTKEGFVALRHEVAARICADACSGLHAAHEAVDETGQLLEVIHRDISPPNILVSLQGQVKVSDFGVAKARHQLHERTRTGEIKGKFAYLAPEQIVGGPLDRRLDLYAMGCVLYTATLGHRPFGNGPAAMSNILKGLYKLPRQIDPSYPPPLEAIIVRALRHDPSDRYQDAESMREDLEQWLWSNKHFVSPAEITKIVKERMSQHALETAQQLSSAGRGKSKIALQFLFESTQEEPSTAGSGIIVPSAPRADSGCEPSPDSTTAVVRTDPLSQRTIPSLDWPDTLTSPSHSTSEPRSQSSRAPLSLVPPPPKEPSEAEGSPKIGEVRASLAAQTAASDSVPLLDTRPQPQQNALDKLLRTFGWVGLGLLVMIAVLWWIFR